MKLTKEQWIKLSNIFHNRHDGFVYIDQKAPAATFFAVVKIVEEFLSAQGLLDNRESKDPAVDETAEDYLDRLVSEASPAWEGVDPEKFMDDARGRTRFGEALNLLRKLADLQNGPPLETYREEWIELMADVHRFLYDHNA